ncbi:MAG TPA: cell wall-binding repeat-containing protein, partial [Acidimicrobiales bacterium]|nr:cell wall-binding repeat-containing protein [Acidimicrobiales bacterium]
MLTRRSLLAATTAALSAFTATPALAQSTEPESATTTTSTATTTTTVAATQTGSTTTTSSTSSSSTSSTSSTSVPKSTTTTIATTAHQITLDIAFPTDKRAGYSEGYYSPRTGHIHQATDLMGPKMYKLYAAVAGTACTVGGVEAAPPSWGYSVSICGDDGRKYNYLHVNNDNPGTDDALGGPEYAFAPGIRKGVRVARGQWIGYMGDSGNSEGTAPHLHFEIEDPSIIDPYGTHKVNPYHSLQAARARNDYPPDPGMPAFEPVDRLAGADRVETATLLSRAAFPNAAQVVIASSTSVADAMAAGPLAASTNGPVLITPPTGLDPRVAAEIRRLGATTATVIGGTTALGPQVETDLATAGVTTLTRVAGADRYDTAVKAAERVWGQKPAAQRKAVIALGNHPDPARAWPDALTAGYLGSLTGAPVLLVGLTGATPGTLGALDGISSATIIGG